MVCTLSFLGLEVLATFLEIVFVTAFVIGGLFKGNLGVFECVLQRQIAPSQTRLFFIDVLHRRTLFVLEDRTERGRIGWLGIDRSANSS